MKTIAFAIVILLSASPAFAHRDGGSWTSAPSHSDRMIVTSWSRQSLNTTTSGLKTNTHSLSSFELHRVFKKDLRVEREIVTLMNTGRGNSPRALALKALDLRLATKLRQLGFTGT